MNVRRDSFGDLASAGFSPIRVLDVELAEPLPSIRPTGGPAANTYSAALCLVRLHGEPLGSIQVELGESGIEPAALARSIARELGGEIERHLREDGLDPRPLGPEGLPREADPPCRKPLEDLLRDAPRASVVIPTRNRPASVRETLDLVLESEYPRDRFEVIVVDNASGEDERVTLPPGIGDGVEVRLLREEAPGGSSARNAGLRAATGELVVFCDDDVAPDRHWLASLVLGFRQGDRVGAVAGLSLPRELETHAQVWYEGFSTAVRGYRPRLLDRRDPPPELPLFPFTVGDLGTGQNFAFRRDVFTELGGFDPALGTGSVTLGGEDVEAMFRVLLADRQLAYMPGAIVRHSHPDTFEQFERRVWGYGVGLTACFAKILVHKPSLLPELLRKLPRGLVYALSPHSAKNESKPPDYPRRLTWMELRGMAYGPVAYARSRRICRREARRVKAAAPANGERRPLRALIVTDSYWPLIGGANRSIELLAQGLARRGHAIEIATAWQEGLPAVEERGDVRIHRLRDSTSRVRWVSEDPYKHNPPPFPDPEAVWRLRRLIRELEPDIVHAYGWLTHSTAVAMLGRRTPLLISARSYANICAVHNLVRDGRICEGPAPLKCLGCSARTYGAAKGAAAAAGVLGSGPVMRRRVTAIHSVSHFVAGKMDRYLRVPGARDVVVPNFHEDVSGQPLDEEVLARLPDEPFVLYVGAFRRIKGIEQLFEAYGLLEDPPPLVLAGTRAPDTPDRFPDGAVVVEDVPHPTVMAMWERAMFGVFPTITPEALGNVVHEAMSRGRAVIGTRPGGHEDMIDDDENGLLVPAGDVAALAAAMARLAGDPALRERLGAAALERAREFTPEAVMPRMESLYYETIADFERKRA
jgi:glycosyltransferase involved in cell wall biosynthesis/GT2 family glycosyltransferase